MDDAHTLFLDMRDEILLSAKSSTGYEIPLLKGNRIRLPDGVVGKLGVDQGGLVGLVQRENAVAIKKVEIIDITDVRETMIPHSTVDNPPTLIA